SAAHAGDISTPPASTPPSATTSVFLLNIDFAILIQLLFDCARNRVFAFVRERCGTHGVLYCKSDARRGGPSHKGFVNEAEWVLLLAHPSGGVGVLRMQHPNTGMAIDVDKAHE
ncbi:hypothetical protein, partial [Paraburkholderia sp.]|uniref:hypothetical protein n=1 Tax=Paraburkholderia sp. TaxID=1926495 RepID=UPI002D290586